MGNSLHWLTEEIVFNTIQAGKRYIKSFLFNDTICSREIESFYLLGYKKGIFIIYRFY